MALEAGPVSDRGEAGFALMIFPRGIYIPQSATWALLLLGEAWGNNPRGLATKYRTRIMEAREEDRDFRLLCVPGHLCLRWHRVPVSKCQLFLRLFPPAQLPCGLGPSIVYSGLCFSPPSAREQGEVGPAHPGVAANGKSAGPSAEQGSDGGDGACVKTCESLPPPLPTSTAT